MKKTILLTVTLIISYCGYSQYAFGDLVVKPSTTYSFNRVTGELQAVLKDKSDTLEIVGNKIKFIKIDGKIYEIKRTTELKEVEVYQTPIWLRGGTVTQYNIHTDTATWINSKIKNK